MKECIAKLYDHIVKFVSNPLFNDDIRDVLIDEYDDFESILRKNKSEIVNNDCPIVVAGNLLFCFVKFVLKQSV